VLKKTTFDSGGQFIGDMTFMKMVFVCLLFQFLHAQGVKVVIGKPTRLIVHDGGGWVSKRFSVGVERGRQVVYTGMYDWEAPDTSFVIVPSDGISIKSISFVELPYDNIRTGNPEVENMRTILEELNNALNELDIKLQSIDLKFRIIDNNMRIGGTSPLVEDDVAEYAEGISRQFLKFMSERRVVMHQREQLSKRKDSIEKILCDSIGIVKYGKYKAMTIEVVAERKSLMSVVVHYYVPHISWSIEYNVYVDEASKSAKIEKNVIVENNSNETFRNVIVEVRKARSGHSPTMKGISINQGEIEDGVYVSGGGIDIPAFQKSRIRVLEVSLPVRIYRKAIPNISNRVFMFGEITGVYKIFADPGKLNIFYNGSLYKRVEWGGGNVKDTLVFELGVDTDMKISMEEKIDESYTYLSKKKANIAKKVKFQVVNDGDDFKDVEVVYFVECPFSSKRDIKVRGGGSGIIDRERGIIQWRKVIPPENTHTWTIGVCVKCKR